MRLKISEVNFTNKYRWIFKLTSPEGQLCYIMNDAFYKKHNRKSPLSRKQIEYLDKGQWISASVEKIEDLEVVTYLNS
jgi:hypothetical protein